MSDHAMSVVVAGATGFIGGHIGQMLGDEFELIGLSRSERPPPQGYTACRSVDLFSRADTIRALEGARIGIYLVHSMMPPARLVQASFQKENNNAFRSRSRRCRTLRTTLQRRCCDRQSISDPRCRSIVSKVITCDHTERVILTARKARDSC